MSAAPRPAAPDPYDRDDIEPRVLHVLERKLGVRARGPYSARGSADIAAQLGRLCAAEGLEDVRISDVQRMSGGASKEQFSFTLEHAAAPAPERLVLRMDPAMGIVETCRGREAELFQAFAGVVPVPPVRFVDADGEHLGQPGLVTGLVPGVTAPSDIDLHAVTGVGIRFDHWIPRLAPQFVDNLVRIHQFDWSGTDLRYFEAPRADTAHAALRQVNWWARVWAQDRVESMPIVALTERWLRQHAPACARPVVVHGDYRIGNFMFTEPDGEFSAILDWELAHLGDFHEDLAWTVQRLFSTRGDAGQLLCSGLLTREDLFAQYAAATGNDIDLEVIRYYEILNAWKCIIINNATACRAAAGAWSHQDLVLTWLACSSAVFVQQIVALMNGASA